MSQDVSAATSAGSTSSELGRVSEQAGAGFVVGVTPVGGCEQHARVEQDHISRVLLLACESRITSR